MRQQLPQGPGSAYKQLIEIGATPNDMPHLMDGQQGAWAQQKESVEDSQHESHAVATVLHGNKQAIEHTLQQDHAQQTWVQGELQ